MAQSGALKLEPIWKVPVAFHPLIGREREVADVCGLLQRQEVRLLTLTGTGGIGKTRLSIEVAATLRTYFAGVCFVSLSSVREHDLVMPAVAQELGIQEFRGQAIFEQVKAVLQARRFLLVLDNFEQVVQAALLLLPLLVACPELKLLVTSRAILRVQGEYEYPVPPLPVPDARHLPDTAALAQNPAIALFLQRAQATKPDFQLTPANAQALAEICTQLDGLPLALELAAARIKLLPPQALLQRLEHRFQVLTLGSRDAPPRQQTLQNTMAWSYDLLNARQQRLLRLLSVFVDSCSLEAIEAVATGVDNDIPDILDGVSSLLDQSLLLAGNEEDEPRLHMLQIIREYGLERLQECGEAAEVQGIHALYYLTLAEMAEPQLKGAQQIVWRTRLDQEQGNIRAALNWLIQHAETELAMRLCAALGWYWYVRGHWSEWRRWLEAVLALPQAERPTLARARVLALAGRLDYFLANYEAARAALEESVALCRTLDSKQTLAYALCALGMLLHVQGDNTASSQLLAESEALCRTHNFIWELSLVLAMLSFIAWKQGDLEQAKVYTGECLILAWELGDTFHIAEALSTLSSIAGRLGELEQTKVLAQEALAMARELGDKSLMAATLQNLGYLAALQRDLPLAVALVQESLTLFRELGDKLLITVALHSIGYAAWLQGDMALAAAAHQEGLSLSEEMEDESHVGLHLIGLAAVSSAEGRYRQAARLLGAAETRFDVNANMNELERADYERVVQRLQVTLGEKDFATAKAEGRRMSPQEALTTPEDILLEPLPPTIEAPAAAYPAGLTEREAQVLRLVAQGLTNAEIADQLIVSIHTVNAHMRSIFNKLDVTSRSAATRFAIEQNLL